MQFTILTISKRNSEKLIKFDDILCGVNSLHTTVRAGEGGTRREYEGGGGGVRIKAEKKRVYLKAVPTIDIEILKRALTLKIQ